MSKKNIFHLKYKLYPGKWTREQLELDYNSGGCDAVLIASIIKEPTSKTDDLDVCFIGVDGTIPGQLDAKTIFKVWVALAGYLAGEDELPKEDIGLLESIADKFQEDRISTTDVMEYVQAYVESQNKNTEELN